MGILDRYIFSQVVLATALILGALAGVMVLVQSLRFVDVIVEAGASAGVFWTLVVLALPRFLEILGPLSLSFAVIFVYARMTVDKEITVSKAAGIGPLRLSVPAFVVAGIMTCSLFLLTLNLTPRSMEHLQAMQHTLKTQMPELFFREGVFAMPAPGLTLYMRAREGREMRGLLLHDARSPQEGGPERPATILARSGMLTQKSGGGQEIVVLDGMRHEYNTDSDTLNRLDFDRYIMALPEQNKESVRWLEPAERQIHDLLFPDPKDAIAASQKDLFALEAHRRLALPFLPFVFVVISMTILLKGQIGRFGPGVHAGIAILAVAAIQGLFLIVLTATQSAGGPEWALAFLWATMIVPSLISIFFLIRERHA